MNGAENHTTASEGPYSIRKANAKQAYFEWLPIRKQTGTNDEYQIYRTLRYGNLVDFIMLDTRLHGREEQNGTSGSTITSPSRQLLGTDQFTWLGNRLDSSSAKWKVLTQQVMFAPLKIFGQAVNGDQWDGYPAERNRVINHIISHTISNVVVITGDIHSSWANDIPTSTYNSSTGAGSAGVEFVGPSVTSPGINLPLGASAIMAANSHIKYADLSKHGFLIIDINNNKTQCDWFYVNTLDNSSNIFNCAKSMYVNNNERFLRTTALPTSPRPSIFGIQAPLCPRQLNITTHLKVIENNLLLNVFPNPAQNQLVLSFLNNTIKNGTITVYNQLGTIVYEYSFTNSDLYNNQLNLNINELNNGAYVGKIHSNGNTSTFKFLKMENNGLFKNQKVFKKVFIRIIPFINNYSIFIFQNKNNIKNSTNYKLVQKTQT